MPTITPPRDFTLAELDALHAYAGIGDEWHRSEERAHYLDPDRVAARARAAVRQYVTEVAEETCRALGMDPWEVLHLPRHLEALEQVHAAARSLRAVAQALAPDLEASGRLNGEVLA